MLCFFASTIFFFVSYIVSLGSIPEFPAETCTEIKASEGGQAVSGKYWFDSILAGQVVFAYCDMETEGKLENLFDKYHRLRFRWTQGYILSLALSCEFRSVFYINYD